MSIRNHPRHSAVIAALAAMAALSGSGAAHAVPVTISNAGYWLETLGENTLGLPGSAAGSVSTVFAATTDPGASAGTTATATQGATSVAAPVASDTQWTRRIQDPTTFQRQPLTVVFQNGTDTAAFTGFDLRNLSALPLAGNLAVDGSSDPLGPVVSWTLPSGPGIDIDRVQLAFYSNATNNEIGTRINLAGTATSYDLQGPFPAGLDLTISVRFVDLADDAGAFTFGNVLRNSRSFINYSVPSVPEPRAGLMMLAGLASVGMLAWRRKDRASQA